jgi:putative zinc finger/helix-turn-helix YgiT family protein
MKKECMSEKLSCPTCEAIRDVELIGREEKVTIKGREVSFVAHFYRCPTCGKDFEAPGQLDQNLEAAREAYARLYQTPSPEELVALRARYRASQKAFGLILGFGELTINSYERGAVPDSPNRLLLKLAENPVCFKVMYEQNKNRIGATQRQRIESSDGYDSILVWSGLEALVNELTPVQKDKIEACARRNSRSILQQVIAYVEAASFRDYSKLMLESSWSDSGAQIILTQGRKLEIYPLQDVS